MKIYVLILLAIVTIIAPKHCSGLAPAKRSSDIHNPGGLWRTRTEWKAHWMRHWELKKVWVPAWKKVWAPVEIKEWIPFPEHHHKPTVEHVDHVHHVEEQVHHVDEVRVH